MATIASVPQPLVAPVPSAALRLRVRVAGAGTRLPAHVLDNAALAAQIGVDVDWIVTRSGVRQRYCAQADETTASLAVAAAQQAIDRAPGFTPDLLLCATFTPERLLCPTAPEIASRLGLVNVGAFDLNAACAGAAIGLITAIGFLASGLARHVLLVCSDTTTKFLAPADRGTRVVMSDGAAALALSADPDDGRASRLLAWIMGSDGRQPEAFCVPCGGSARPRRVDGEAGSTVTMDGRALFRFGVECASRTVHDLCARADMEVRDLDWIVVHQGNLRMIQGMQQRVDVPGARWLLNVDHIGNTVSASIPFLLAEHIAADTFTRGDRIALVGFGAGLSWAGLLLEW